MARKPETLNLRESPDPKERFQQAAARVHRIIASFIEVAVREHCARRGVRGRDEPTPKLPKSI